jgi:hypothetical protein
MGIGTPKSSSVAEGLHGFHLHISGFELRTFSEVPNKGLSIPISRREIDGYKVPSTFTTNFLHVLSLQGTKKIKIETKLTIQFLSQFKCA